MPNVVLVRDAMRRFTSFQIALINQRIQVGMIHARKIVTVTARNHSFQLDIDGETVTIVPRTTSKEIHRYKGCATQRT